MSSDIVARLRILASEFPTVNGWMDDEWTNAADEIERLRGELGQVSDADSWVSKEDASHLDSLLNWCEFNAMDWHRALARLVNDRARLRAEVIRLRSERDEARRDRCMARAVIRWDLEHPNSPHRSETTIILLAWQIADEEGWNCFDGRKR